MFVVLGICAIGLVAVVLYSVLSSGGWGAWLIYVACHAALVVWLFAQSAEGKGSTDKVNLFLLGLLVLLYVLVAAIVAIVRAVNLWRDGRASR